MIRYLLAWWHWLGCCTLTLSWPAPPSREDWTDEAQGPLRS